MYTKSCSRSPISTGDCSYCAAASGAAVPTDPEPTKPRMLAMAVLRTPAPHSDVVVRITHA